MAHHGTRVEGTFRPLRDGILIKDMEFGNVTTAAGIIIISDDGLDRGIHPRWGLITAIGPDQEDVKVGEWILVAHGRWSRGFELNGDTVRTVDPNDVLAVSSEAPAHEFVNPSMGHQSYEYQGQVGVGKLEV
tara:strand:- start:408 stop:803 length:396 start_codon:yes stop_codon:yes gene_type:complete